MKPAGRFAVLWAMGLVLLAPLHGLLPAVGSGLIAALVGGAFLYAGRRRPDAGLTRAALAVLVLCALLWLGASGG